MVPATANPPAIPYASSVQVLKEHTSLQPRPARDEGETDNGPASTANIHRCVLARLLKVAFGARQGSPRDNTANQSTLTPNL